MWFIAWLVIATTGLVIAKFYPKKRNKCPKKKHFLITGGSSGIGRSLAVSLAKKGASVTIMARNALKLKDAELLIKKSCVNRRQSVTSISVDVTNYAAMEQEIDRLENTVGPIFGLVNCAGMAICGKLEDCSLGDIKQMVDVNLMGTLYATKLVVPRMKARKEGIIVITSSQVALMGMFGYSVYSSCKFALRGLAESIDMEVRPYNITVTLALPPDTDTPGFENENKTKPLETQMISKTGGLFQPDKVAKKILSDALGGKFFSYIGFESWALTTLCVGMSPFSSFFEVVWQTLVLGPLRLIGTFYLISFHNIIKECAKSEGKSQ